MHGLRFTLLIVMLLACTALISGCTTTPAQTSPLQTTSGGPLQNCYANDLYRICAPGDWLIAPAPSVNAMSLLATYDYFVNVVVSVDPTTKTQPEYFLEELGRMEGSELYVNTQILNQQTMTVDGNSAPSVFFTYTLGYDIKAQLIVLVRGGNAYGITYQTEEDYFDDHHGLFLDILNTFELL